VSESPYQRLDLRILLDAVEAAPPVDAVDVLARELATMLDATAVSLLITNFTGDAVVRMSHVTGARATENGRNEREESLPLAGSPYEEVLQRQELDVRRVGDRWQLLVPVTERGDAIGLLELSLRHPPAGEVVEYVESAAHALAFVLIASRRHTDLFEWAQRDTPFSLAAEIQRRLLPSAYTIEGGPFTVAGWLEPAADVGGDTFDYSVDREYLYVSLTDAMGHSTTAALLATLTVGSLRNTRRAIASPAEQSSAANEVLLTSASADQFVTGLLIRIRLADGTAEIVNAGHPPPFLLRNGRATRVDLPADPPLGVLDVAHRTHRSASPPATGSSSSPTASWSATRSASASRRRSSSTPSVTPGRSSESSGGTCCPPPAATSATTLPPCASTGTALAAARDAVAGASRRRATS
jgi:hypothetical protein